MSKKEQKEKASIAGSSEGRKPDPDLFHNHELSLLQFNARVLDEALDERNPLLERVKFIGIVCSNLDEFYQKRIGGLKRQVEAGVYKLSVDGLTPKKQLKIIRKEIRKMDKTIIKCLFGELVPQLAGQGISFRCYHELEEKQKQSVDKHYFEQIYPLLTPLAIDHSHPFPFISNKSLSLAVELQNPATGGTLFARLKIPSNLKRWMPVPDQKGKRSLILIEDVIRNHLDHVFSGARVLSSHVFRVTRNADISRNEEEADDLLEMIEEELRERRFAEIVRVEMESDMPDHIRSMILKHLDLSEKDVYETDQPIGMADAMELYGLEGFPELRYDKWVPVPHPAFRHEGDDNPESVFDIIKKGDILVHHPYHSFSTSVERFVREAADDPDVMAIKQTIYRTSDDSPHLHALIRAAERGKQVAILVELYDAARNGVKIDLIVRGVCRLRAGVKGTRGNIAVNSVIGRYLEHSRIYYFHHGGENLCYIGSADWMRRNLDKRVEVLVPVDTAPIRSYLMFVLETYLNDNSQRWALQPDGDYKRCYPKNGEPGKGAHRMFMEHTAAMGDPVPAGFETPGASI